VVAGWAPLASALTIERLDATHDNNRYTVEFEVVLDAPRDKVWAIMTDYEHLGRTSKVIIESKVITPLTDNHQRISVTFDACVFIFCKKARRTLDVELKPSSEILVKEVPAQSDFRSGREHWLVGSEASKTRLRYTAELEPGFFVPPLIGPMVVKYFLQREIKLTALAVEELARHD